MKSTRESNGRYETGHERAGNDRTDEIDGSTPPTDEVDGSTPPTDEVDGSTPPTDDQPDRRELAERLAEQICRGFLYHDDEEWEACVAAFYEVDRHQFPHLSDDEARTAAVAYAAALWAKDEIEPPLRDDGTFDSDAIDAADWNHVRSWLERRANIVGMDREYATCTAEGWRKHKTGDDYWTPLMRGQHHEIRVALDDPAYPRKEGTCRTGFGPLTARYLVGLELHDMKTEHHWKRAVDTMIPYFEQILRARDSG